MTTATMKEAITGKPGEPEAKKQTEYERFRGYVQTVSFLNDVAVLVGGEANARTFVRVVLTAVQKNPRLLEVDRRSLLLACMAAARDRLMPDGKEAVLNIYNTEVKDAKTGRKFYREEAQYLPMAAGLIKKMYDSGHVSFVDAAAVYQADEFIYERGDAPKLVHRPNMGDEPGPIVAAYVVVKLTNGETKREVMPRRDIEKVRAASKAPDGFGWRTWYDQFAIKSVVKRAYKQLPSSVELDQVIKHDNEAMGFREATTMGGEYEAFTDTPAPPTPPETPAQTSGPETPAIEHKPGETIPPIVGGATPAAAESPADNEAANARKAAEAKVPEPKAPVTIASVMVKIHEATTPEALNLARDLARTLENKVEQRQANVAADEKARELRQ